MDHNSPPCYTDIRTLILYPRIIKKTKTKIKDGLVLGRIYGVHHTVGGGQSTQMGTHSSRTHDYDIDRSPHVLTCRVDWKTCF